MSDSPFASQDAAVERRRLARIGSAFGTTPGTLGMMPVEDAARWLAKTTPHTSARWLEALTNDAGLVAPDVVRALIARCVTPEQYERLHRGDLRASIQRAHEHPKSNRAQRRARAKLKAAGISPPPA